MDGSPDCGSSPDGRRPSKPPGSVSNLCFRIAPPRAVRRVALALFVWRDPPWERRVLLVPCGRRGLISQTSRRTATGTVGAEQTRGGSTPLRRTIRLSWPADVQSRLLPHPAAITAVTSQRAGCQHQTASRAARLLLQSRRSKAGPVCLLH